MLGPCCVVGFGKTSPPLPSLMGVNAWTPRSRHQVAGLVRAPWGGRKGISFYQSLTASGLFLVDLLQVFFGHCLTTLKLSVLSVQLVFSASEHGFALGRTAVRGVDSPGAQRQLGLLPTVTCPALLRAPQASR